MSKEDRNDVSESHEDYEVTYSRLHKAISIGELISPEEFDEYLQAAQKHLTSEAEQTLKDFGGDVNDMNYRLIQARVRACETALQQNTPEAKSQYCLNEADRIRRMAQLLVGGMMRGYLDHERKALDQANKQSLIWEDLGYRLIGKTRYQNG